MATKNSTFRAIALETLTLTPLMAGKNQIKTEELSGEEVTVTDFDFATITDEKGEEKTFPVLLLDEYPDCYYNGGTLLMKLCMAWASAFGGDPEAASVALKKEGGVRLRFKEGKTKRGQNITTVEVL